MASGRHLCLTRTSATRGDGLVREVRSTSRYLFKAVSAAADAMGAPPERAAPATWPEPHRPPEPGPTPMITSARARTLAVTLDHRMRELGLDQRALAERAGVAPATVRQLQQGAAAAPRPTTLAKLSRALDWPPDALVRVLSAVPDTPPPAVERPTYEAPSISPTSLLDRVAELEEELAALRRLVTASLITRTARTRAEEPVPDLRTADRHRPGACGRRHRHGRGPHQPSGTGGGALTYASRSPGVDRRSCSGCSPVSACRCWPRARSSNATKPTASTTLLWRAVVLLALGLALQLLDHGVLVILADYALLFVLGLVVMRWSDAWLLALAGASATVGSLAYRFGEITAPSAFLRQPAEFGAPRRRQPPRPRAVRAVPAHHVGRTVLRRHLARTPRPAFGRGAAPAGGHRRVVGRPDPRPLLDAGTHPDRRLRRGGMVAGCSTMHPTARCPCGCSARRHPPRRSSASRCWPASELPRTTAPLAAAGRLAFTWYVAHLLILHLDETLLRRGSTAATVAVLAVFTAVVALASVLWSKAFARGPLEHLLRPPWVPRTSVPARVGS
jgi:transcriptional regulator with XRE-family HTH domain